MTMTTVSLHRDDVAYVHHPGVGTPLVLVHGVGSSTETWGQIPQLLAEDGRTVVAVDLLGHGASGHGNGDYSLGSNASRIRDLLDHLGIGTAHLVGHSLGGGVCLQFLYQFPERVTSLTLISSGGLGSEVSAGLRAASLPGSEVVFQAITSRKVVHALTNATQGLAKVGVNHPKLNATTVAKLERLQDRRRLGAFLATVRSVVGPQGQTVCATDRFGAIRDPQKVLIIWGDRDEMIPVGHGLAAHRLLHGSRFVVIPGAGHHPHTDSPDRVRAEILQHVMAVDSGER